LTLKKTKKPVRIKLKVNVMIIQGDRWHQRLNRKHRDDRQIIAGHTTVKQSLILDV
jgi:hypothetical protein